MNAIALATLSIFMLLVAFAVGIFCQLQIQRRLHFTRTMQNANQRRMHQVLVAELAIPPGTKIPGFQKRWAFYPMQLLNVTAFIATVVVILYSTSF